MIPVLPQNDSGTRDDWLDDLGVLLPCARVVDGRSTVDKSQIEDSEGTDSELVLAANPQADDVITPCSVGVYLCQTVTAACPATEGG